MVWMGWDGIGWDRMRCDAMRWDGMGWDGCDVMHIMTGVFDPTCGRVFDDDDDVHVL